MKKTVLFALFATALSANANTVNVTASLAGSEVAMTAMDLNKTQIALYSRTTGSNVGWYNENTATHYDIVVGENFGFEFQPCINYQLSVKHNESVANENLNACLSANGKWIAKENISLN